MLRDEMKYPDRPWSVSRRALAALLLVAVTVGALLLNGPALAGANAPVTEPTDAGKQAADPFDLTYVMEAAPQGLSQGFIAFRPAAAFRHTGMDLYRTMLNLWISQKWAIAANKFKFDPTKRGQTAPRIEMFEQVTADVRLWRSEGPKPNGRIGLFGFAVRSSEPVDWKTLFSLFNSEVVEVRDGDRTYFRVKNFALNGNADQFFFCPDDRTLVMSGEGYRADSEERVRRLLHRDRATPPPSAVFAQGKDWDRLVRGLVLVGLDNRGGSLSRVIQKNDATDEAINPVPAFEHADFWTFGLENDDQIKFRAVGTCTNGDARGTTAQAVTDIIDQIRRQIDNRKPVGQSRRTEEVRWERMSREFFKRIQIDSEGRSVSLQSAGLGSLADFASLVAAGIFD